MDIIAFLVKYIYHPCAKIIKHIDIDYIFIHGLLLLIGVAFLAPAIGSDNNSWLGITSRILFGLLGACVIGLSLMHLKKDYDDRLIKKHEDLKKSKKEHKEQTKQSNEEKYISKEEKLLAMLSAVKRVERENQFHKESTELKLQDGYMKTQKLTPLQKAQRMAQINLIKRIQEKSKENPNQTLKEERKSITDENQSKEPYLNAYHQKRIKECCEEVKLMQMQPFSLAEFKAQALRLKENSENSFGNPRIGTKKVKEEGENLDK